LPDALLETGDVAVDLDETRLVLFGFDQREQFRRVRKSGCDLIEFGDGRIEPRAFASERLRLGRQVPDRGIAELAIQLFEPLAFFLVLKGTPSAPRGAE